MRFEGFWDENPSAGLNNIIVILDTSVVLLRRALIYSERRSVAVDGKSRYIKKTKTQKTNKFHRRYARYSFYTDIRVLKVYTVRNAISHGSVLPLNFCFGLIRIFRFHSGKTLSSRPMPMATISLGNARAWKICVGKTPRRRVPRQPYHVMFLHNTFLKWRPFYLTD